MLLHSTHELQRPTGNIIGKANNIKPIRWLNSITRYIKNQSNRYLFIASEDSESLSSDWELVLLASECRPIIGDELGPERSRRRVDSRLMKDELCLKDLPSLSLKIDTFVSTFFTLFVNFIFSLEVVRWCCFMINKSTC